ncbi:MAG: helix-turn-helix domain-containing protein [Chloroflexota bacterium]|nr:helix-turn-helix domain-containing protein [Chloroflexota bacterium]
MVKNTRARPEQTERQTLTVEEVAAKLGISRGTAYGAVRTGEIPALRIGRRYIISRQVVDRLLAEGRFV